HSQVCHFVTALSTVPLESRPMATLKVDDDGIFWFFSPDNSHKNDRLHRDNRVQMFYSKEERSEFLTVYGTAEVLKDRNKIKELWTPVAKAWFHKGKEDPNISILKISPHQAHYWDIKNNIVIQMMKIVASVISNTTMDDGQ